MVESDACQITLEPCWSFSISSLMRPPALATWSVSGGQKVLNAHPVVRLVIRGVFKPDHAYWNVVSEGRFRQCAKNSCSSEIADRQGLLRKRTNIVESSGTRRACANRIGIVFSYFFSYIVAASLFSWSVWIQCACFDRWLFFK